MFGKHPFRLVAALTVAAAIPLAAARPVGNQAGHARAGKLAVDECAEIDGRLLVQSHREAGHA